VSNHQADLERLVPARILHRRLQEQMLDGDLELIVPTGTLDGVAEAYGLPVRQVEGLDAVYLAHRLPIDWRIPPEFDQGKDGPTA
jgi:hypothetical protein